MLLKDLAGKGSQVWVVCDRMLKWTLRLPSLFYWTSPVKFVPRPQQQTQEIPSLQVCFSGFGGLEVACWPLVPKWSRGSVLAFGTQVV